MDSNSELLLSLYRGARTMPTVAFQDWAIRLLRPALRFESAIWGAGYFKVNGAAEVPSLVPIRSAMHEIDPAGFAFWKSINRADKIIPIVRAAPWTTFNFHAPSLFSAKDDLVMRDYAHRFGRQSYLVTALSNIEVQEVLDWCSIYRSDPEDHFSETERLHCQMLMAHLSEAMKVNQLVHGGAHDVSAQMNQAEFMALVDSRGRVLSSQQGFADACRRQWREFDGQRVPDPAMRQLTGAGQGLFRGRWVTLRARRLAEHVFRVTAGPPSKTERLPPRQMDVATLFADGYSNKEIARILDLSPSTVRNQISTAYRNLGVSSRLELRGLLRQDDERVEIDPEKRLRRLGSR